MKAAWSEFLKYFNYPIALLFFEDILKADFKKWKKKKAKDTLQRDKCERKYSNYFPQFLLYIYINLYICKNGLKKLASSTLISIVYAKAEISREIMLEAVYFIRLIFKTVPFMFCLRWKNIIFAKMIESGKNKAVTDEIKKHIYIYMCKVDSSDFGWK